MGTLTKTTRAVIGLFSGSSSSTGSGSPPPDITMLAPIIPLQRYLDNYLTTHDPVTANLKPPPGFPTHNIKSTNVAFSLLPLTASGESPYYAGAFDDAMNFSASLVKAAALFAAAELFAEAKVFLQGGTTDSTKFFKDFDAHLKSEISSTADARIRNAAVGLQPVTTTIFKKWTGTPSIAFTDSFKTSLSRMIVQSSDSDSAICIQALGYGFINTALIRHAFFSSANSKGIWLAGDYGGGTKVRIPCENDHDDAQVITTRQMCRLFTMIRLNQLPQNDSETNALMQSLLNEPKTGPGATGPWLSPGRSEGAVALFSILQDKIGFAGLGSDETPNVYSEGLIIKWSGSAQIDSFNNKIDPTNSNSALRLSGEVAVCWQNLLAEMIPKVFDGITEVLNHSISDFLDQTPL